MIILQMKPGLGNRGNYVVNAGMIPAPQTSKEQVYFKRSSALATIEHATGIDVSHYKKRIDWKQVRESGVQFAVIKATEADNFVDSRFDYNWTRTRRFGMIRGAYHFFRPLVDPVRQANNFIKIAGRTLHKTDLPPVLDIESYPDFVAREWKQISLNDRIRRIQIWLQTVEKATGKVPMIYTGYYAWRDYIGNTEKFVRNPLWIASYQVEQPKIPANNWGGRGWTLWQTTEKGIVPGIRDEAPCVDLDLFKGSFEDLKAWLNIEAPRALPPEVTNGDMMAAIIDAADLLGASSDDLVTRARLRYLVDPIGNSFRPYDGPAVQDLSLTEEEKAALAQVLEEDYIGNNASAWSITHQDLINAFYTAASQTDERGWALVERAGLDYIGEDRGAIYEGPVISRLPGLTEEQRATISEELGLGLQVVIDPVEEVGEVEIIVDEVQDQETDIVEQAPEEIVEEVPSPIEEVEPELPPLNEVDEDPISPGVPVENIEDNKISTYGNQVDNQAIINAFYLTAIKLDQNGRDMINAAELEYLTDARMDVYSGPRIELLPGLTRAQREMIAEFLGIQLEESLIPEDLAVVEDSPNLVEEEPPMIVEDPEEIAPEEEIPVRVDESEDVEEPLEIDTEEPTRINQPVKDPTYPGLVNQDLINLFYRVASFFGENGWHWIVRCGLAAIGASRKTRFEDYRGPNIKSIPGLTPDQIALLEKELNQLKVV
ncbi:MAG: hypothetical protein GWN30_33015 [Gammaproteobacteria bacterium]|nr:hypothetical protein [Gammaproteobacteria bacterium]